jgi:hypothetical protein
MPQDGAQHGEFMARINIEDSLFKDGRFTNLCIKLGTRKLAIGALVEAWMLAQTYVSPDNPKGLIPVEAWAEHEIEDAIIEKKLAKVIDQMVVELCGAQESFAWLVQKQMAAKKGGMANASRIEAEREPIGSTRKPKLADSIPLDLTPTLPPPLDPDPTVLLNFDFERLYNLYPRKEGKSLGFKKCSKIKSQKDYQALEQAIRIYAGKVAAEKTEIQYIKQFSSFMTTWRDWLEYKPTKSVSTNKMISNRDKDEMFARMAKTDEQRGDGLTKAAQDPKMKEIMDKLLGKKIPSTPENKE